MVGRKGKPCKAKVRTECGCSGEYVEVGRLGHIVVVRYSDAMALVKWKGRRCPSSHPLADLDWA